MKTNLSFLYIRHSQIETNEKSFSKRDEDFKLYSGVPVVVGIITGKRSFIDYFITPFRNKLTSYVVPHR